MTDSVLLRAAAGGDAQAFTRLIEQFAPSVYGYLAGMLGDEREAADAMEETFVRLARAVGRYETDTEPAAWIFSIARRVASDLRPTPAAPPNDLPTAADPRGWALRALRALSIEHRETLVCQEILKWDTQRLCVWLNIPKEELQDRLTAARTRLAETMSESD